MAVDPNSELIVLVDPQGNPIGSAPKLDTHHAKTPLHLAFSVYIFDDQGKFLVTKRAAHKKVWPDVWTNSCCGNPMPGESMEQAITRRVDYELGMTISNLRVVNPTYTYQTPAFNGIIEHEFCPIYIATASSSPRPNPEEVSDLAWISWEEFTGKLLDDSQDTWSWWTKDQKKHLDTTKKYSDVGKQKTLGFEFG